MKKIILKHLVLFLGVMLIATSCLKTDDCGDCFTPPPQLFFKVVDADTNDNLFTNFTYSQVDLKLYYLDGDDTTYLNVDFYNSADQWIISSAEMSWLAISENGETFYLELDTNTTEIIQLKIVSVFENCCTFHQIEELTVNGSEPEIEPFTNNILIKK